MREFWPVSDRLGNVVATPPTYLWLSMEPTGIEPVTSCLQSDCADTLNGLISARLSKIPPLGPWRGYGGIGRD
jgi:hypothetical protein